MFLVFALRPIVLAIFAKDWFFGAFFFMFGCFLRFYHELAHVAFYFFMEFFLRYLCILHCVVLDL